MNASEQGSPQPREARCFVPRGKYGDVRGKYYQRYQEGTNIVLLDDDVAKVFHDSTAVNEALRRYLEDHGEPRKPAKRRAG